MMSECIAVMAVVLLAFAIPVAADPPDSEQSFRWESLLPDPDLDGWHESGAPWSTGTWLREGKTVTGQKSDDGKARITQGDSTWKNYLLSVNATPIEGQLQIHFRMSNDGKSFYMLDFWTPHSVAISMRGPDGIVWLDVVEYPTEIGREYEIVIAARGRSLTSYIDGKLVNRVTDDTFSSGGIGFNLWHGASARFRNPRIRRY